MVMQAADRFNRYGRLWVIVWAVQTF